MSRITQRWWVAAVGTWLCAASGQAVCNAIPGATTSHRGAVGTLNRPFASPGDYVGIEVNRGVCENNLRQGLSSLGADHVVTVLFDPPNGPRNAVVLASSCGAALGGIAVCASRGPGGLFIRDSKSKAGSPRRELFFQMPLESEMAVPFGLAANHTLSGPAKLIVTTTGSPLECATVASTRCAAAETSGSLGLGTLACIDELYEFDGSCDQAVSDIDPVFGHFVALPTPKDFAAICEISSDPNCGGSTEPIRFTTDIAGNVLAPFDYGRILKEIGADGVPVARLARVRLTSFIGGQAAPQLPNGVVSSHAPEGARLPPFFTPLSNPNAAGATSLLGSIDAERGVVRVARMDPSTA